jgi:hypothetical protein
MSYPQASANRVCARTGRVLQPGEKHMVLLVQQDQNLAREDICMEAWSEPGPDAFAWWQTRVPERHQTTRLIIDDGLLYDCFTRLEAEDEPAKIHFRYVLALWLLRKRKLKFEDVHREQGQDWLLLREPRNKKLHRVQDPHLNEEAIKQVQQEVETMLQAA